MIVFDKHDLDAGIVKTLRALAAMGWYYGKPISRVDEAYVETCKGMDLRTGTVLIFTRDVGHHTCGWLKNPDYDKCEHLSLSFFDAITSDPKGKDRALTERWVRAFFGVRKRWIWCEPPHSPDGKRVDVWHYRLFCSPVWAPIKPRGEPYSREFTEAGWKTWGAVQEEKQDRAERMRERWRR